VQGNLNPGFGGILLWQTDKQMHYNGTKQKAKTDMNTHTRNMFLRQLYLLLNITEILSKFTKEEYFSV
jgi:hypothetical protein